MLAMCGHLRLCDISTKAENTTLTVWQNNFWLVQLNYLHLAQAALHCSDFFAVILYSDIWCQRLLEYVCHASSFIFAILYLSSKNILIIPEPIPKESGPGVENGR